MKVLITGGAGFIGSHTADRLLKEGYEEYSNEMNRMMNDRDYYIQCANNSGKRYEEIYNVPSIISKFVKLYQDAANKK